MEQMFEVAGKQIQCESVTTRPDGSQLLCRNLWWVKPTLIIKIHLLMHYSFIDSYKKKMLKNCLV